MPEDLILSGRIVDIALAILLLEIIVLALAGQRRGGGIPLRELVSNAGAGAGLMLALRAALTGAGWLAVAGWLGVALALHVADLALRWRSAESAR